MTNNKQQLIEKYNLKPRDYRGRTTNAIKKIIEEKNLSERTKNSKP